MVKKILLGAMFCAIIIMSVGLFNTPVNIKYTAYSESVCQGHTCREYLLSQMYFKNINITELAISEMCDNSNWAQCNNKYKIESVDGSW